MKRHFRYVASGLRSTLLLTVLGCLLVAALAGSIFQPASASRAELINFGEQFVAAPQNQLPQIEGLKAVQPVAESQDHLHGAPLEGGSVLELRDGQITCRPATEAEARAMRNIPDQQLRVIGDEAFAPGSPQQARKGLKIILRGTPQIEQFPEAKAAFLRAARAWETLIQNPITVVIDVDFGPTAFGKPFGKNQYGVTRFQWNFNANAYPIIRSALIRSAGSPQEAALYNALPPAQLPTDLGAATGMIYHVPAMRALGLFPPVADPEADRENLGLPPGIAFNSAASFDFDPSDGIKPKRTDFNAAAMHEIGHALGFYSGVGIKELNPNDSLAPDMVDLFRFRPGVTSATFSSAPRIQSSGGEHVFFGGGPELPLSTGRIDGTGGDGREAGHWKDDLFTGRYIGIKDPHITWGFGFEMTANDREAFELLGYRTNPLPDPREAELKLDDGTIEDGAGNNGWMVINRLTPTSYPATLRKLRILIPAFKGQPDPAGKPITLLYGHSNPGAKLERLETTVPSASLDLFLEFTIPNGPTINAGDFYVGYQAPSPHQGVGFAADLGGSTETRSFLSTNNGASFAPLAEAFQGKPANAMIRALVSIPGPAPTPTPTPRPTPGPETTVALVSGAPQDGYVNRSWPGGSAFETQYTIQVPSGATQLKVDLSANTDLDLFARFGSRVAGQNGVPVADFSSVSDNYHESITITPASSPALQAGVYYLMVVNYGPGPSTFKITATVTAGQSCAYSLIPASLSFEAAGGSGSVYVLATSGCNWTASSNADWVTLTAGSGGSGEGTVRYSVAANNSTNARAGTLTIAGQAYTVAQAGKSASGGPTEILAVDDGAPEGNLASGGIIYVNRLTPTGYPATLRTVRIFFRKFDTRPNPAGSQIKLIAFTTPAGAARPPENPPLLLDRTVAIPAISPSGEYVDFPIANGPTINAGDLYVGFQLPNPNDRVGAFFDLNSTNHLRSFSSPNGGAFYFGPLPPEPGMTSTNLLVRAVVSVGGAAAPPVVSVSAASFNGEALASEAITAAFGSRLATTTLVSPGKPGCPICLTTELAGTRVMVKDSAGTERPALLFFVSPGQVNYLIPAGTAIGTATVTVTSGDGSVSIGTAQIATVAPGIFTANGDGQGAPAAVALRVKPGEDMRFEEVAQYDSAQRRFVPRPLDLGAATDQVFLVLFGTGLRQNRNLSAVSARIGGVDATVHFAGAHQQLAGLDQINVGLPRSLIGRGEVDVVLMVDGRAANKVKINIK